VIPAARLIARRGGSDDGDVGTFVADARLAAARTFEDTNRVLAKSRQTVAWGALGHAVAYEAAVTYAFRREQFGRPLARFQLVQDKLSHMLADITAMQTPVPADVAAAGRGTRRAALRGIGEARNRAGGPGGCARWPATSSAATASCSTATTPTSRRSTPTRAPTRSSR
jgi:alkylation response protein AidB-like acyl-CoA dehydrogenase